MVNLLEAIDHRMSPGSHAVMLQLYFEPQIIDIRGGKRDWKRPYIIYGKPAFNPRYCCIGISMHVCGVFVWCLWFVSEFHYSWHFQSHEEDVM